MVRIQKLHTAVHKKAPQCELFRARITYPITSLLTQQLTLDCTFRLRTLKNLVEQVRLILSSCRYCLRWSTISATIKILHVSVCFINACVQQGRYNHPPSSQWFHDTQPEINRVHLCWWFTYMSVPVHRSSGHTTLTTAYARKTWQACWRWRSMTADNKYNWQEPQQCSHGFLQHSLGYLTLELIEDHICMLIHLEFHFTPNLLDVWRRIFSMYWIMVFSLDQWLSMWVISQLSGNPTVGRQQYVVPL